MTEVNYKMGLFVSTKRKTGVVGIGVGRNRFPYLGLTTTVTTVENEGLW